MPIHPQPADDEQQAWFDRIRPLLRVYDPAYLAAPIALFFILGVVGGGLDPGARLALLPALGAMALIVAAVALVGPEYRYRYPADPLITVVALGGLRWTGLRSAALVRLRGEPIRPGRLATP